MHYQEIKAAGAYGRQSYHLHVPNVLKSGNFNLLETFGFLMGLYRDCFAALIGFDIEGVSDYLMTVVNYIIHSFIQYSV